MKKIKNELFFFKMSISWTTKDFFGHNISITNDKTNNRRSIAVDGKFMDEKDYRKWRRLIRSGCTQAGLNIHI